MAKLADKIRRTIGRIPPGRLFDFRPFVHYADGSGLGVVIFRLVKNGTLKKIAKGVYYRPSRRKGQLREPTAEQILDFLTRRGRTILRYESGESLWYKRGYIPKKPRFVTLVGDFAPSRGHFGKLKIKIEWTDVPLLPKRIHLLQLLDILEAIKKGKWINKDAVIESVQSEILKLDKDIKNELVAIAIRYYSPVVKAVLAAILRGKHRNLSRRLESSLNKQTRFNLGISKVVLENQKRFHIS